MECVLPHRRIVVVCMEFKGNTNDNRAVNYYPLVQMASLICTITCIMIQCSAAQLSMHYQLRNSCPSNSELRFRSDGQERCVCTGDAVCVAPLGSDGKPRGCLIGRLANQTSPRHFHGFSPKCRTCACAIGLGSVSKPSGPVARNDDYHTAARDRNAVMSTTVSAGQGSSSGETNKYAATLERRKCAQSALYSALGFDYNQEYFVMGCNSPAIVDFDAWAEATGCGSEPITEKLLYHTAWTGPVDKYREEFGALLDSWLMTQDTARSEFHFWWMDQDPDPENEMVKWYTQLGNGVIQFHRVDLYALAEGTCLEGQHEYLNGTVPPDWHDKKVMGPKEKADLTRILLLNKYGGIWLDTDDVLLRDLRPLFEFSGEFATKLTMSFYFNNNVLGIRRNSTLSRGLVDIVCQLPYSRDTRHYCEVVKTHCYPKWYWNNGVFQIAKRSNLGAVVFPMSFTDPAYGCFPPMLLSASGGAPCRGWTLDQVLEMIRGAFVLHTRGYNAKKPLHPESNFYQLYARAKAGALRNISDPVPLVNTGKRSAAEDTAYAKLYARLRQTSVEPPFLPTPPWVLIQLQSPLVRKCLFAARSPGTYGKLSPAEVKGMCATDDVLKTQENGLPKSHEQQTWQWHMETGYIRPAIREPGRIYCLDAIPVTRDVAHDNPPMANVCHPGRPGQLWDILDTATLQSRSPQFAPGRRGGVVPEGGTMSIVRSRATNTCISVLVTVDGVATSELRLRPCNASDPAQQWSLHMFHKATHGALRTNSQ
eukprot:m.578799 g.578799  ORF g.578799 m.578799 type:complete len:763 (+) comp22309_c0_seq5:142-2430(+)